MKSQRDSFFFLPDFENWLFLGVAPSILSCLTHRLGDLITVWVSAPSLNDDSRIALPLFPKFPLTYTPWAFLSTGSHLGVTVIVNCLVLLLKLLTDPTFPNLSSTQP